MLAVALWRGHAAMRLEVALVVLSPIYREQHKGRASLRVSNRPAPHSGWHSNTPAPEDRAGSSSGLAVLPPLLPSTGPSAGLCTSSAPFSRRRMRPVAPPIRAGATLGDCADCRPARAPRGVVPAANHTRRRALISEHVPSPVAVGCMVGEAGSACPRRTDGHRAVCVAGQAEPPGDPPAPRCGARPPHVATQPLLPGLLRPQAHCVPR